MSSPEGDHGGGILKTRVVNGMKTQIPPDLTPGPSGSRKAGFPDLAIAGGAPAFGEALHVGRPNVGNRERLFERIGDVLDRKWLTNNGEYVREFEQRISEALGVGHSVAMSNGTVALEIASRALGLSGEVILPSFTFVATAHALQWQGITPVFCDVDPATHTLDPDRIEERISPATTGIIAVHVWGQPCDVTALARIAARRGLKILYDASHAFGCSHLGQMVGQFGEAEVFSFHATKFLNTFEGGAVVTNNGDLAGRMRLMRNFGFTGEDRVVCLGTNGKMNEVSAAMGLTGLESVGDFVDVNHAHYKEYRRGLAGIPGVNLLEIDEREKRNYQYVVLEIDSALSGVSRDEVACALRAENVLARRYFFPGCHRFEPYRTLYPDAARFLPETERLVSQVLCLPTGTAIGQGEIDTICDIIRLTVSHASDVKGLISGAGDSPE